MPGPRECLIMSGGTIALAAVHGLADAALRAPWGAAHRRSAPRISRDPTDSGSRRAMTQPTEADGRSDAELVAACRENDASAWRTIVHRHGRIVHAVAASFRLQPADADEVFQLTFAALLRHLPRLREPERLGAWLVTASRRVALRWRQSEQRRTRAAQDASAGEDAWAPSADAVLERLRERERVRRSLESLGDPCRTLLLGLFARPPVPYRAMAKRLGLAVGSLGSLRSRCLARLRSRLRHGRAAAAHAIGVAADPGRMHG